MNLVHILRRSLPGILAGVLALAVCGVGGVAAQSGDGVVEAYVKLNSPNASCETLSQALAGNAEPVPDCKVIHRASSTLRLRWSATTAARVEALLLNWKSTGLIAWFEFKGEVLRTQSLAGVGAVTEYANYAATLRPQAAAQGDPNFVSEPLRRLRTLLDLYDVRPEVVVAVIDSGVNFDSPELAAMRWHNAKELAGNGKDDDGNGYIDDVQGWDFVDGGAFAYSDDVTVPDNDPSDHLGHGTVIATIIEKTLGEHARGLVKIMPLRVASGVYGTGSVSPGALAEAIYYAVDNGAKVVNISVGGTETYAVIQAAIEYGLAKGVLFVAAAGNSGGAVYFPARIPGVLAIGAVDEAGAIWSGSAIGEGVDVFAQGTNMLVGLGVTAPNLSASGTSYAAPVVTAASAMLIALLSGEDASCSQGRTVLGQYKPLGQDVPGWLVYHVNRFESGLVGKEALRAKWLAGGNVCGATVTVNALLRRPG